MQRKTPLNCRYGKLICETAALDNIVSIFA